MSDRKQRTRGAGDIHDDDHGGSTKSVVAPGKQTLGEDSAPGEYDRGPDDEDTTTPAGGEADRLGPWDADADLVAAMGLEDPAAATGEPVQSKPAGAEATGHAEGESNQLGPWEADADLMAAMGLEDPAAPMAPAVQAKAEGGDGGSGHVHQQAAMGVAGSAGPLPHQDAIQASFGAHDVSGVRAHTDGAATEASAAIGAQAYATGNDVAFGTSAPSLHTAAHEAAHVVQQRGGVQLAGGAGEVGDSYEQHADRVADAVVAGGSSEPILSEMAGGATGSVSADASSGGRIALQRRGDADDADLDRQPAALVVEPDQLTFSRTAVGTEAPAQSVTVTNAGDAPVSIDDVAATSSSFAAVFPTYADTISDPIEAGGSVQLQFGFRPSGAGRQATSYSIITDGRVRSGVVQLEGTGFSNDRSEAPKLDAAPRRLKMSPAGLGEESAPVTLELTNAGTQPVTIEQLNIRPAGKTSESEFTVYGEGGEAIEPGESAQMQVGFRPEKTGLRRAHLDVLGNQGAKLASVSLKGKGLSRTDARYQGALHGSVTATSTYDDMLAALLAAKKFTELRDEASYRHAHDVLDPVIDRMGRPGAKDGRDPEEVRGGQHGGAHHVRSGALGREGVVVQARPRLDHQR